MGPTSLWIANLSVDLLLFGPGEMVSRDTPLGSFALRPASLLWSGSRIGSTQRYWLGIGDRQARVA